MKTLIEGGRRTNGIFKKSIHNKPLVTIATVVRNSAASLGKTIESVINQTYENIEYIIVDGASTDGTLDVLKQYEPRLDYWISQKDKGVYYGMNTAIDLARGEWINFMNAGDWFYNNDIVQTIFDSQLFPGDIDFLYGDFYFLYSNGTLVPLKANPLDTLWQGMAFSHQSMFTRTEYMVKQKFSHKYKSASDYHFIINAYKEKRKFFYLNEFICVYADDGISIKRQLRSLIERWRIARNYGSNVQLGKREIDKFHITEVYEHLPKIINRLIGKT